MADDDKIDLSSPEVKKAIDEAVAAAVDPLKKKNDQLLEEKQNLAKKFESFDEDAITKFQEFQKRMENDEEAKLIAEGKLDEVINRRTERMRDSLSKRVAEEEAKSKEWQEKFITSQTSLHNTLIDSAVRNEAIAANVVPTALDDVITRARAVFQYDDGSRSIVSKDPTTGEIKMSDDAKNPYSPKDFIGDLKKNAPHFWPASQGAGFTGGGNGASADFDSQAQAALQKGGMAEYLKVREKQKKKGQSSV